MEEQCGHTRLFIYLCYCELIRILGHTADVDQVSYGWIQRSTYLTKS